MQPLLASTPVLIRPDPLADSGSGHRSVMSIRVSLIFGNQEAVGVVDTLIVVTRGSQIFSNGSRVSPVIFTSRVRSGRMVRSYGREQLVKSVVSPSMVVRRLTNVRLIRRRRTGTPLTVSKMVKAVQVPFGGATRG